MYKTQSRARKATKVNKRASELPDFRETYSPDAKNAYIFFLNKKFAVKPSLDNKMSLTTSSGNYQ
jgi:hypothetical protein